jgi:hypothetical protein
MLSIISIMKSTERYSADTQITDPIDSKISAAPRFYKLQSCLLLLHIGLITLIQSDFESCADILT